MECWSIGVMGWIAERFTALSLQCFSLRIVLDANY